ncbi:MAG: SDR family NAD(P)-dependent oxidoreductase, partial [Pseudomonadota bacterium]
MAKPQKSVVVTGVSSGIGLAIAKAMVDEGWRVFGSVRKQSDADTVAQTLGDAFTPLIFDVTDQSAIDDAAALVADMLEGRTLGGLVNNAGVAV